MDELEHIEAQAYALFAEATGGGATAVRGGVCLHSPLPTLILNRVVNVTGDLDLDGVAEFYGGAAHLVCVAPWAAELGAELETRGYARTDAWAKLTRDAAPAPAVTSTMRVEPARDETTFAATVREGFGAPAEMAAAFAVLDRPGFAGFIAWDSDEPAAAGAVLVDGSQAWFGAASTRPAFRGRGAQTALLAARIEHARSHGATTLSVETSAPEDDPNQSYRNVERAGFNEAYIRGNWHSPA